MVKTTLALTWLALSLTAQLSAAGNENRPWDLRGAAAYLDQRAAWWITWKPAARDQNTFCISCHTGLPYALGRSAVRGALGEEGPTPSERALIENVTKRVRLWNELQPLYSDAQSGASKSAESRGTEAVLNALILVNHDAGEGKFSQDARQALDNIWALQEKTGEHAGAVSWLNFHYEPWEADDSPYWGATLAAVAAGSAPEGYRSASEVRENVRLLREYLLRELPGQSLFNRVGLLWASATWPGLLTAGQRETILESIWTVQRDDGGWSAPALVPATWKRKDSTPLETSSDGYATAFIAFVLRQAGVPRSQPRMQRAMAWLEGNQDKATGMWPASSLNKRRDPSSDAGKFMSDAATAYAVAVLTAEK